MSERQDPLNDTFDMNPENLEDDVISSINEITEEQKSLDYIIEESMRVYQDTIEDAKLIEPKLRARHLEIAHQFLNQSKDAMYKKEQLDIKKQELELRKNKQNGQTKDPNEQEKDNPESQGTPRSELLKRVK
jgi:hypothetical protein